jgi:hypothetical protein
MVDQQTSCNRSKRKCGADGHKKWSNKPQNNGIQMQSPRLMGFIFNPMKQQKANGKASNVGEMVRPGNLVKGYDQTGRSD